MFPNNHRNTSMHLLSNSKLNYTYTRLSGINRRKCRRFSVSAGTAVVIFIVISEHGDCVVCCNVGKPQIFTPFHS
jgi:hypothetical protein